MRVPSITTYNKSTYMLGDLTSNLQGANEEVSTQKRIIEVSDDPVGLNQVLTLKNSLGSLEQIDENVAMGKSWLNSVETALDSANNLTLEVKTEVTRLANDSTTSEERTNAIERINSVIEQMVSLGNTQVNGNYIFGGTDTDKIPLSYDALADQVTYNGNHIPFSVRTDKTAGVAVGRDGEETFWDKEIQIGPLNDTLVFTEDIGRGSAFEKTLATTIPDGTYTVDTLAATVRNRLNEASAADGYQVTYQVAFDADQDRFVIQTDGSYDGFIQTTFLWEDGGNARLDEVTAGGGIDLDDLDVQTLNHKALVQGTRTADSDEPMRIEWDGDEYWVVKDNPGYVMPSKIQGTAYGFDLDLTESGSPDIRVKLDEPAAGIGAYVSFHIVPATGDTSVGHEMGFSGINTITSPPVSDVPAEYITDLTITSGVNDTIDFQEVRSPSFIAAGTIFNADYTAALDTAVSSGTIAAGSTLAAGSIIGSGTTLGAGTVIGSGITLAPAVTLAQDVAGVSSGTLVSGTALGAGTVLGPGTQLASGTTLGSGSVIGSGTTLTADVTLGQDVTGVTSGLLASGSSLTAGTVLGNGTTLYSGSVIGSGTTLTTDVTLNSDVTVNSSGTLTATSFIASGSTLTSGTILASGEQITLSSGAGPGTVITGDGTQTLAALAGGSIGVLAAYTVISGGDTLTHGITTLGAGSVLAFGTASGIIASGSALGGTKMTLAADAVLHGDMTLQGADLVLTADTNLFAGTDLAADSQLAAGSHVDDQAVTLSDTPLVLAGGMTLAGTTTLDGATANNVLGGDVTLTSGTTLGAGSILASGTHLDDGAVTLAANVVLTQDMSVVGDTGVIVGADMTIEPGTVVADGSTLSDGTVLDVDFAIDPDQAIAAGTAFTADYGLATQTAVNSGTLIAGSTFAAGSTLVSGAVLGSGTVIGSGTTLTADVPVATDIDIHSTGTLTAGSFVASGSILTSGTVLAAGEQIDLANAAGSGATISGNGVSTLGALAGGTLGSGPYTVTADDTLSHGIDTLSSGSTLAFGTASGVIASGSVLNGSSITLSSGITLNGDMTAAGDGVTLGADMTITAGTVLAAHSIVAAGSTLDVPVITGGTSDELTAVITAGNYTDMDALCAEIKAQLESSSANNITYAVTYDAETSRFNIREDGTTLDGLNLLWESGSHAATSVRSTLGYYEIDDELTYPATDTAPVHGAITIDAGNDTLDFEEIDNLGASSGTLKAFISHGTYTDMTDLLATIESAMEAVSANGVDYSVSYDNAAATPELSIVSQPGALSELRLFTDADVDSVNDTLGFDLDRTGGTAYGSDTPPVLMTFNSGNNRIDFQERNSDGVTSDIITVKIPEGTYTDLDDVATALADSLTADSPNQIIYDVTYDYGEGKFTVKAGDDALNRFSLLWHSGPEADSSAAEMLGFDPSEDDVMVFGESDRSVVRLEIDGTNNKIDFQEQMPGEVGQGVDNLTAVVASGTYTSYDKLAHEIEKAMETVSHDKGNDIDYTVSWDEHTRKFSIKENGTQLEELRLLWASGDNAPMDQGGTGEGIGTLLGFDATADDVKKPLTSIQPVKWGIFETLIDLKQYLSDNDRNGLERTLGRLESNYNLMTSRIVDTGMKYNRLIVRETINTQISYGLTERRSTIEDADTVASIMKLQNIQVAYQAALGSTAKVINLSLMDYLT